MPTVKVADTLKFCQSPEHNPLTHMVFEPGAYLHTCPVCGKKTSFIIAGTYT